MLCHCLLCVFFVCSFFCFEIYGKLFLALSSIFYHRFVRFYRLCTVIWYDVLFIDIIFKKHAFVSSIESLMQFLWWLTEKKNPNKKRKFHCFHKGDKDRQQNDDNMQQIESFHSECIG